MNSGALGSLKNHVNSWAQLIGMRKFVNDIESSTKVDGQWLEYFPFILEIKPVDQAGFSTVIGNRSRHIRTLCSRSINRKDEVGGICSGSFHSDQKSTSNHVAVIHCPTRIELHAVIKQTPIHSTGDAIEDQVTLLIGRKQCLAVAGKCRQLETHRIERFLVSQNQVMILLVLIFVQVPRVKLFRICIRQAKCGSLVLVAGYLEIRIGAAQ